MIPQVPALILALLPVLWLAAALAHMARQHS